ncbi:helix-turn-helix transcriptional regulator [Streptomyces sp. NBC_01218]|nr:helix-turn-helix transcriptional regulator [Streptomyces sp. NBC_01218]
MLRRLRATAELTREEVTERTGINGVTLYRIEKARARPQRRTLTALMEVYGADEAQRSDLLAAERHAQDRSRVRPYHAGLSEHYTAYIGFEAEARTVRAYEPSLVPGLLQTERYARAVAGVALPEAGRPGADPWVAALRERQAALGVCPAPRLRAVVDEAAVRRVVGGSEVMREQVEHLLRIAAEPRVRVQVIPFGAGAHAGMAGGFVHLEFPDPRDPELVYLDTPAGDLFLESEEETRRFRAAFEQLRSVALDPRDSAELLAGVCRS